MGRYKTSTPSFSSIFFFSLTSLRSLVARSKTGGETFNSFVELSHSSLVIPACFKILANKSTLILVLWGLGSVKRYALRCMN